MVVAASLLTFSGAEDGRYETGKPWKKPAQAKGDNSHPYETLFELSLRMDLSTPMLKFRDLRDDVRGDKT